MGRAPIDEDAIRLLEEYNPDVQFDWTRILKTPSQAGAPQAAEPRRSDESRESRRSDAGRDSRRSGERQEGRRDPRREESRPAESHAEPSHGEAVGQPPAEFVESGGGEYPEDAESGGQPGVDSVERRDAALDDTEPEPLGLQEPPEPAEPLESPEPSEPAEPRYARIGAQGLMRLRARYAEVMARIAEKPLDEAAKEELRTKAERLNPDAWVTEQEVADALEQYETVFEALRPLVGRHPRRRRRRRV